MKLILRHGTREEFAVAGAQRFTNATAVVVTDPPALRRSTDDRAAWTETPLERDLSADVSGLDEFEVRRIGDDVIVRIGGEGWRAGGYARIGAVFPVHAGVRPVSTGRLIV